MRALFSVAEAQRALEYIGQTHLDIRQTIERLQAADTHGDESVVHLDEFEDVYAAAIRASRAAAGAGAADDDLAEGSVVKPGGSVRPSLGRRGSKVEITVGERYSKMAGRTSRAPGARSRTRPRASTASACSCFGWFPRSGMR